MSVSRTLVLLFCLLSLAGCSAAGYDEVDPLAGSPSADDDEAGQYQGFTPGPTADGYTLSNDPLIFDRACESGDQTITIGAVGDLLLHGSLQRQAYDHPDTFKSLWSDIAPLLEAPDIMYANLEGPAAQGVNTRGRAVEDPGMVFGVNDVYTSYPQFNYHPQLIVDLVESGFDIVSTSNNHSLDHGALGADRTIEALEEQGLPYTGTRRSDDPEASFHTSTFVGDVKIAWLACTYGTNGIPDRANQVLHCFSQREQVLAAIESLSARPDIDAVIATPHWGSEYHGTPNSAQIELAHDMVDAGALAVIGAHPHVLQPWERYVAPDGREALIAYSLGNFVSNQNGLETRSTALLYFGLTVHDDGEDKEVFINGARFVPMYMLRNGERKIVDIDPNSGNHEDSLLHTLNMFGDYNLMRRTEDLVTNPQCDPDWRPTRATPTFIGDPCSEHIDCVFDDNAYCHDNGFCTVDCDGTCPDRSGYATTFCAEISDSEGICVLRADSSNNYCAALTGVEQRPANRYIVESNASPTVATACLPEERRN